MYEESRTKHPCRIHTMCSGNDLGGWRRSDGYPLGLLNQRTQPINSPLRFRRWHCRGDCISLTRHIRTVGLVQSSGT